MTFIDDYVLERVLSERGAVITRLMRDQGGALVVVKTLSVRRALDAREIDLFEREAGILKHLRHPAVPRFVDYAVQDDGSGDVRLHLAQSFVEGRNLNQWIREGRSFAPREAVEVMRALAEVLVALHGSSPSLVHRYIKPSNVMMNDAGTVFLIDFGAAKRAARDGTAVGTFGYMAPEQMEGRASPASDVFGVGMTMIFLLTHQEPEAFAEGGGVRKTWRAHANVDDNLAALLDDCIAIDEGRRPRDGAALHERIASLGKKTTLAKPHRSRMVLVVSLVSLLMFTGLVVWRSLGNEAAHVASLMVAVEVPKGPLSRQRIPASVRLGAPGLLENLECTGRAGRALASENRYRSWREGDAPPTCQERYVMYGLYTLYDDAPQSCQDAARAATSNAAARDAADALALALAPLTATTTEAASYYRAEDYRDDGCAAGVALHARLLPEFARVRVAYAQTLAARRELAKSPPPNDEAMRGYRRVLDAAMRLGEPTLALADRRAAVDAYAQARETLPKPIDSYGVNLETLRKWARGNDSSSMQAAADNVESDTARAIQSRLQDE